MGEDEEDAALAAACLRGCCAALSSSENLTNNGNETRRPCALSQLVMDGQQWTTWMADLQELAAVDGVPSSSAIERTARSVGNTCRVLAAVAGEEVIWFSSNLSGPIRIQH
eukprot:scaffold109242_cov38-Prasinocladus_malaysianus.AAC.1